MLNKKDRYVVDIISNAYLHNIACFYEKAILNRIFL